MLKKIKTTKQMRLDELIKYVWDNNNLFKGEGQICFEVDGQKNQGFVCFENNMGASFSTSRYIELDETFTVEIEEPITEYTVFKCLLEIIDGELVYIRNKKTIKESVKDDTDRFYALIDGKLQLVWERDEE